MRNARDDVVDDFLTEGGACRKELQCLAYAMVRALYDHAVASTPIPSGICHLEAPRISRISKQGGNALCAWHVVLTAMRIAMGAGEYVDEDGEENLAKTIACFFQHMWMDTKMKYEKAANAGTALEPAVPPSHPNPEPVPAAQHPRPEI
jgi:hypothetical protein